MSSAWLTPLARCAIAGMSHSTEEACFLHFATSPAEDIMKAKSPAPKAAKPQRNLAPKNGSKVKGGYLTYKMKNAIITSYSIG